MITFINDTLSFYKTNKLQNNEINIILPPGKRMSESQILIIN